MEIRMGHMPQDRNARFRLRRSNGYQIELCSVPRRECASAVGFAFKRIVPYCGLVVASILVLFDLTGSSQGTEKSRETKPDPFFSESVLSHAISQEKATIRAMELRTPLVETYIQFSRVGANSTPIPTRDQYFLSRVNFGAGFFNAAASDSVARPIRVGPANTLFPGSRAAVMDMSAALGIDARSWGTSIGFTEMMFPDPAHFDELHYRFRLVRTEYLGEVRSLVFDVCPEVPAMGRFQGRIWIEDSENHIIRVNGAIYGPDSDSRSTPSLHFDSWRMNLQPGLWLPVAIYVEDKRGERNEQLVMAARVHFWGYSLPVSSNMTERGNTKYAFGPGDETKKPPLNTSREVETNTIGGLERAGLIAPFNPVGVETAFLNRLLANLEGENRFALDRDIHFRILLTDTIEVATIGNTILISKGLFDAMPQNDAAMASVVAFELAQILSGSHHDSRALLNSAPYLKDGSYEHFNLSHSETELQEAAIKAQDLLETSRYHGQLPNLGLFWSQLSDRGRVLKALNTPVVGDSLLKSDGSPWMTELAGNPHTANPETVGEFSLRPLGDRLRIDPWDDRVTLLAPIPLYPTISEQESAGLELTAAFYSLNRLAAPPSAGAPASPGIRVHQHVPVWSQCMLCLRSNAPTPQGSKTNKQSDSKTPEPPKPKVPEPPGTEGGTPGVQPKPSEPQ